jgi:hypothetical protein
MNVSVQNTASSQTALFIKMAIGAWKIQNDRIDKLLGTFSDEQWSREIAPSKNTGVYLLGHLVAVNDALFPLFELGERRYPELEHPFVKSPDKSGLPFPPIETLKKYWTEINAQLLAKFEAMSPEAWFARHTSVTPEDFAKEPHRNKLNVLLNRTSHQSYHIGQLMLLK